MTCTRGAASPNHQTQLRLFAASAGYCQNPSCRRFLFVDTGSVRIHIAEMAHVFAANNDGPRPNLNLSQADRGTFENLILLCPSCHTVIDKAAKDFPDTLVTRWKLDQQSRLEQMFGAVLLSSRAKVRSAIAPLLKENSIILEQYGPDLDYREDPESELALSWKCKMRDRIIPNSRKILAIVDANRKYFESHEERTLEFFRQHVHDLEARHLACMTVGVQQRFPSAMDQLMSQAN